MTPRLKSGPQANRNAGGEAKNQTKTVTTLGTSASSRVRQRTACVNRLASSRLAPATTRSSANSNGSHWLGNRPNQPGIQAQFSAAAQRSAGSRAAPRVAMRAQVGSGAAQSVWKAKIDSGYCNQPLSR